MSDRQGSVRAGSRDGAADDAAAGGPPAGAPSSTQAIPATGGMRAQSAPTAQPTGPATGAAPAGGFPAGAPGGFPAGQAGVAGGGASPAGKRPGQPGNAARTNRGGKGGRGPRRARLQLRHIDIWSAFKISLVLSIALFFIWLVAVGILYGVLSGLGVFDTLNDLFGQLSSSSDTASSNANDVITPGVVFLWAGVIGAINVVLMTALFTVGTFIYNLCADLVGGLEVTLSERD